MRQGKVAEALLPHRLKHLVADQIGLRARVI